MRAQPRISASRYTYDQLKAEQAEAARTGTQAKFWSSLFGRGAFELATVAGPFAATKLAEGASAAAKLAEGAEVAGDAGKADAVGSAVDAGKDVVASASSATKGVEAAVTSEAGDEATFLELPSNLGGMEAPRTLGLGERASMSELVRSGAVPGSEGVILTDQVASPAELYGDMFKLSQQNGVEYALTREGDNLVLRSGAPNRVRIPLGAEPVAHTHPFDPEMELPQTLPSRTDVNVLNNLWNVDPDGSRPVSDIIWGLGPDQVTRYHATGLDLIPDPTKGGLKPGRTW